MLNPMRFRLTPDQLAAALSIAGLQPGPRSALPANTPPPDSAALRDTGLLEKDGRLTEAVTGALRIAADPAHTVGITANRAGQANWIAAQLLRRDEDDTFVMQAGTGDDGFDFAVAPTLTQATALVDELLDLTSYGPGSASPPIDLDLIAFTALLAATDAAQAARLAAVLGRKVATEPPELRALELEEQLATGLAGGDTRWALPAAQGAAPVQLAAAAGRMAEGLARLTFLGLVRVEALGSYRFTDAGTAVARSFSQLLTTGSIVEFTGPATGRAALAHFTVFRSTFTTWFVFWSGLAVRNPRAELFETTTEAALRLVRDILDPAAVTPFTGDTPTFEAAAVPAEVVPEVAERSVGQPAWNPTHQVPDVGMPAWATPDPTRPPVARIDPHVELQILEHAGDWAHIACDNGWTAWVDGRAIEPLTAPAAAPWNPTHCVPEGGLGAWASPDPRLRLIARIDPGVELQLLERVGDWAHIACDNGWTGWVDGRAIQPLALPDAAPWTSTDNRYPPSEPPRQQPEVEPQARGGSRSAGWPSRYRRGR
ncbi:SH3 domain-containing protein [Nocardia sp. CA-107356]|uniref:SH3 domain-containing protein n=1 Tax=Nocardia sp. CA-107356 TaxID=3239972 RepID=UPI003D909D6C